MLNYGPNTNIYIFLLASMEMMAPQDCVIFLYSGLILSYPQPLSYYFKRFSNIFIIIYIYIKENISIQNFIMY